jgi:hypothetical protein
MIVDRKNRCQHQLSLSQKFVQTGLLVQPAANIHPTTFQHRQQTLASTLSSANSQRHTKQYPLTNTFAPRATNSTD